MYFIFKKNYPVFSQMETELLIEIKKEQVYVVLTQANIEARLQSSISGGLSDGKWHTLTLSIEDGKR